MGFGFRKSKKFGGVRVNLSKSGLGVSYGIKGLRVSHNSKGTFLNAGTNGVYYRKKLNSKSKQNENVQVGFENADKIYSGSLSYLHKLNKVDGDFEYTIFENPEYVLDELVAFNKLKNGLFKNIGIILFIIGCFIHWVWCFNIALFLWLAIESKKFIIKPQKEVFENLKNLLDKAGDNYILHNAFTNGELKYGTLIVENLFNCPVPFIDLKDYKMCFIDSGILFYSSKIIFLVPYEKFNLSLNETTSLMINPPQYANIISTTYEHVNKDGSPNRRYKTNREINEISTHVLTFTSDEDIIISLALFEKNIAQNIYDEINNIMKGLK